MKAKKTISSLKKKKRKEKENSRFIAFLCDPRRPKKTRERKRERESERERKGSRKARHKNETITG